MEAWEDISAPNFSGEEDKEIWERFHNQFQFSISTIPAIFEPALSVTYFIGYFNGQPESAHELLTDLNTRMLAAFQRCIPVDSWLYALDLYHPSYRFRPHIPFNATEHNDWRVSVFPDGDYHIFLAEDLRFGLFGHPWEQTICVFGSELLLALKDDPPRLFTAAIRENGQQVRPVIYGLFSSDDGNDSYRNAIGPHNMPLVTFIEEVQTAGYMFPTGHAHLITIVTTEAIDDPYDAPAS